MQEKAKEKIIDRSFRFIVAQTVMCIIAILICLGLKVFGGYYYNYSKTVFDENFNQPINMEQVLTGDQAKEIVAAQATIYGTGDGEDSNAYLENKDDISDDVNQKIKSASINQMCIPVSGNVTSEYAYRIHPITGTYTFHAGLDIGADKGTKIKSALDGKVTLVDTSCKTSYGKYIMITHSEGVQTLYGHCSKVIAKNGDTVKKGDVIALVGSTGNSTGPHLHFEVRINGIRLNPRWFIDI